MSYTYDPDYKPSLDEIEVPFRQLGFRSRRPKIDWESTDKPIISAVIYANGPIPTQTARDRIAQVCPEALMVDHVYGFQGSIMKAHGLDEEQIKRFMQFWPDVFVLPSHCDFDVFRSWAHQAGFVVVEYPKTTNLDDSGTSKTLMELGFRRRERWQASSKQPPRLIQVIRAMVVASNPDEAKAGHDKLAQIWPDGQPCVDTVKFLETDDETKHRIAACMTKFLVLPCGSVDSNIVDWATMQDLAIIEY